ncbi:hypothetical protein K1T71_012136 [Dendrolimus kikuchii]|uniref:Uncharacterized protein n=1 Tax=Dendrolimus kikuchii TaxID=765133 RepID=A0ACC1CKR2_9NEOP|nr:hypothetical protein K1T71_012136 [Dendrolimus kikuchii]
MKEQNIIDLLKIKFILKELWERCRSCEIRSASLEGWRRALRPRNHSRLFPEWRRKRSQQRRRSNEMNPPSALHGAMSRDRKPFTYTPGGLNLSEIKSERMAQRLMRNAMNPGVPEKPIQMIQSPPMPSTPIAVPNYNCLPVQVFPTFNLPANPKSLLRTRSIPDQPRDPPIQRVPPPSHMANNNTKPPVAEYYDTFTKPTLPYIPVNNNRPASMIEYDLPGNTFSLPRNYGSEGFTHRPVHPPFLSQQNNDNEYLGGTPKTEVQERQPLIDSYQLAIEKDLVNETNKSVDCITDVEKPLLEMKIEPDALKQDADEDTLDDKREVKVVKKTVNQEIKREAQNGDQNGDAEAEMTVKLPTKKVGAKTETKVEVVKKILPDGMVEEIKTTTTKTTIDGKTEIKTETETRILSKEEADEEIEEVEEEEEEEEENGEVSVQEVQDPKSNEIQSEKVISSTLKENGEPDNIIKTEERSESTTTTTKKIVVEHDKEERVEDEEEIVEEEEIEESEPVTVVIKKSAEKLPEPEEEEEEEQIEETETKEIEENVVESKVQEEKEIDELQEEIEKDVKEKETEKIVKKKELPKEESEVDEEEEFDNKQEQGEEQKEIKKEQEPASGGDKNEKEEPEQVEVKIVEEKQDVIDIPVTKLADEIKKEVTVEKESVQQILLEDQKEEPKEETVKHEIKHEIKLEYEQPTQETTPKPEIKVPLREPSIPLDKVEDVEIKPIGPAETLTKSRVENTEIITTSGAEKPTGLCTEYNRIENIVTVNRTTKTLDQAYESITQQGVPTVKTYFAPSIDRISTSPLPSSPYQPVYPPVPTTERRHSLLLERLSVERQIPTDVYQYNTTTNNQTYEQQRQWSQEPQAEVLTVSNVKPSSINQNNQQWYQQTTRDNVLYNNVSPLPAAPAPAPPTWSQPKPQPQPAYKPQPTYSPQPTYQIPTYQSPTQPQYKPTQTETIEERSSNTYNTYTPKPTWTSTVESVPAINTPSNQYSYISKDTTDSFKETTQYSSSYVPPPWEQVTGYVANNTDSYYQPPPSNTFTPTAAPVPSETWKPKPTSKFSKPPPTAYIPPAPNQSFVKPVIVEPPRLPGRKTYYSEYERRYITVPESNYIPTETKFQPQPDPSPQYYYDNNEASETVEHEWRKELREFTEKTSQTETNVKPPWEVDQTYAKTPASTYTPTPTWSQTVRPGSWRERSFESEYVSQEWPKTNTLGRGRPLSTYCIPESTIPERTRGVSVDRYNPNSYQSPVAAEHPPVQTHTLTTPTPHAYHNPNVPAYHARASAEPREQPTSYQHPRTFRDPRPSPFQSRSFKYLQWITGTED